MNILYFTVDALRADHVTDEIMPFTRQLFDEATEYTRCYANGPGTPWSFPALLGSRYAGSVDGFGIPGSNDPRPTLAEVLRDAGYATAGFTDNRFASSDYNYDRGFGSMRDGNATSSEKRIKHQVRKRLDDGLFSKAIREGYNLVEDLLINFQAKQTRFERADRLLRQTADWIEKRDSNWFAWVHPMDTHAPYEAPQEYQERYLDEPVPRRESQQLASQATHHPSELTDEEWRLQRQLYTAECRYLDDQLAQFFDELPSSVQSETVVVVTADHGEMHGEHGLGGHPQQFWEEIIHVPCAVSIPGREPSTEDRQISLIDIPPTILDTVDIESPVNWDGYSVLPTSDGEPYERQHVFVDVEQKLNQNHVGIRRADDWKLLRHDSSSEILLDLNSNPAEDSRGDRAGETPSQYYELATALDAHLNEMESRRRGEAIGIEDEELIQDHLRELGYLE